MKKLVKEKIADITPVTLDELTGDELVAYRCVNNSLHVAVLHKLDGCKWGFFSLGYSNNNPTYTANTRQDTIKLASQGRQLYFFSTQEELVRCIYNKVF